jgi:hypothetical protein
MAAQWEDIEEDEWEDIEESPSAAPERYLYNENGTVSGINPEAAPTRQESSDYVRGLGQKLLSGQLAGFGDELVGGARNALDRMVTTDVEEQAAALEDAPVASQGGYEMYRDDARAAEKKFAEDNPNTALGAELLGAVASPLNKVAPGFGAGAKNSNLASRLYQSVARGSAEGGLYGLGQAEGTVDEQIDQAIKGAQFGGGTAGAITGGGGALGRTMSKLRVKDRLVDAAGRFKPIHLQKDTGILGDAYRGLVGRAYGGMETLHKQQEPFLEAAKDAVESAGSQVDNQVARVNNRVAREAVDSSIPTTMPAKRAAKIRQMSPLDAERAISKWFSKKGFNTVKDKTFRWDPQLQGRIKTMLNDNPELKTQVGGAIGGIKRLDDYLNPMSAGGVPGDVLMEIRNTFARKANNPMPSLKGKGNRTIAQEFDAMLEKRLDAADFSKYQSELSSWGPKQALSKAAKQARKAGTDIDAKNIGMKAPDRGPLQQSARVAREEIVGLKKAAKAEKSSARKALTELNKRTTPEKASGLSSLLTTGFLGGLVGGPLGAAAAVPTGIGVSRALASEGVQTLAAGQTKWQEAMAKALQEGDTAKWQQILARLSAQQGAN